MVPVAAQSYLANKKKMNSTWTVREYLEAQRVQGFKWNEKSLRDDLSKFLGGGDVQRSVAQHLKRVLLKTRKVKQILESEMHEKFLDQKRSFPVVPSNQATNQPSSKPDQFRPVQSTMQQRVFNEKAVHATHQQVAQKPHLCYLQYEDWQPSGFEEA